MAQAETSPAAPPAPSIAGFFEKPCARSGIPFSSLTKKYLTNVISSAYISERFDI